MQIEDILKRYYEKFDEDVRCHRVMAPLSSL